MAEELRQGLHRLAAGVDPEAVLVLEDLEVELLDDVVGLRERLQAGVAAVQEATGVAHQAVAGELQQPLPGLGVARHGPLQLPLQDGGRFVAHLPRSLRSGRRSLRFQFIRTGSGGPEKTAPALSLGAVAAGVRNGRQGAARPRPSPLLFMLVAARATRHSFLVLLQKGRSV